MSRLAAVVFCLSVFPASWAVATPIHIGSCGAAGAKSEALCESPLRPRIASVEATEGPRALIFEGSAPAHVSGLDSGMLGAAFDIPSTQSHEFDASSRAFENDLSWLLGALHEVALPNRVVSSRPAASRR